VRLFFRLFYQPFQSPSLSRQFAPHIPSLNGWTQILRTTRGCNRLALGLQLSQEESEEVGPFPPCGTSEL